MVGLESDRSVAGKANLQHRPISKLPFNLYSDERLLVTVKPHKNKFIFKKLFPFYAILALMFIPMAAAAPLNIPSSISMFIDIRVILAFGLVTSIATGVVILIQYPRLTFWITDKRIINRSGIVSYSIRSIPIDVITDIVLHRGPVDLILGTNDILMPTINDDIYHLYKHRSGVNHISSVNCDTAKHLQKTIFTIRGKHMAERPVFSQTVSP